MAARRMVMGKERSQGYDLTMSMPAIDIQAMSPAERVDLIADLWDSMPDSESLLSQAQRDELDRRIDDLDADIEAGRPLGASWEDVRARIESRHTER